MEKLIIEYRVTGSEVLFGEIYSTVKKTINKKIKYYLSKGYDEHDIIEGSDEALLECLRRWDEVKNTRFLTYYNIVSDHRIKDVHDRRMRKVTKELYEPENWESDNVTFYETRQRPEDFPDAEEEIIRSINGSSQRQLAASILKDCDEKLRQQLLILAGGRSANYAATKFGTHPQTFKRKLAKLSRKYNEKRAEVIA